MLSGDNQTEIKSISRKNINLQLISPYLYETSKEHVNTLLENINGLNNCLDTNLASDLFKQAYSQFDYEYNNLVIFYFIIVRTLQDGHLTGITLIGLIEICYQIHFLILLQNKCMSFC